MKLCDTCIYRNNVEQLKPCIIYRDNCEYYEKERDDMTREQAIKWLKDMLKNFDLPQEQYQTALDVAIKALEQEPCDNAISRQIISDYVQSHIQEINTGYGDLNKHTNEILRMIVDYIETMSSVNPQEPKWIPVSERLPNDEEYVLVYYADGSIRTAYYYIDTESYPPEFRDCCETGWYDYNEDFMYEQDVLAWMSLPKPYKVESEENMSEVGVEIVKTEEVKESGIKYLNINASDSEVERNPDIVRICADAGILEYVKPKTGYWEGSEDDIDVLCSECGDVGYAHYNYCPNCGVRMESRGKE